MSALARMSATSETGSDQRIADDQYPVRWTQGVVITRNRRWVLQSDNTGSDSSVECSGDYDGNEGSHQLGLEPAVVLAFLMGLIGRHCECGQIKRKDRS